MSDDKKPMPPQPTTVAFPKVPDWAIELTKSVKEGMADLHEKVDTVATNVEILKDDGRDTKARLIRIEEWKDHVDERISRASTRVRGTSEENLKQDSAIAHIITELGATKALAETAVVQASSAATSTESLAKAMAENTALTNEVKTAVVGLFKNPKVIFVGKFIWGVAMAYAAAKGLKVLP